MIEKQVRIGIDPGKHTGVAVWDDNERNFTYIDTMHIHRALRQVKSMRAMINEVVIEDARVTWFKGDPAKRQGAGSIKRDCTIWEDFCTDYEIPFRFVRPRKILTKLTADQFESLTGYKGKTSVHARDAAMLVFQNKSHDSTQRWH